MRAAALPGWMDEADRARYAVGDGLYDLTPLVLDHLDALGVDVLVTIGGDDTLSYSQVLVNAGVPLIAIPKTMDNDVQGTEYCIGFSTAITRAKEAINRQRTTLGSHERIGVFRIFGRDAGSRRCTRPTSRRPAASSPRRRTTSTPCVPLLAADHAANPSHYAFVVTAEGAIWNGAQIEPTSAARTRSATATRPTSARRWRRRSAADRDRDARLRADLRPPQRRARLDRLARGDDVRERGDGPGRDGVTGRMVAIQDGKYAHTDLPDPGSGRGACRCPAMYNVARFRPRYDGRLGDPMLLVGLD